MAAMWPRAAPDAQVIRLSVQPEGNNSISGYSLAVSPDGKHVAFVGAGQAGTAILWVRSLDELSAKPVPGTAGAYQPFWSPDSRSIGFFAGYSLKRVDLAGGAPQTLAAAPVPYGARGELTEPFFSYQPLPEA